MNRLERMEKLKQYAENQIDNGKDYDMKFCDFRALAIREIHRIELRQKVPLLPCPKCRKEPQRYWSSKLYNKKQYLCPRCHKFGCSNDVGSGYKTDREARLAWNEKMGKDGTNNV